MQPIPATVPFPIAHVAGAGIYNLTSTLALFVCSQGRQYGRFQGMWRFTAAHTESFFNKFRVELSREKTSCAGEKGYLF
jgi:hypothetical protein